MAYLNIRLLSRNDVFDANSLFIRKIARVESAFINDDAIIVVIFFDEWFDVGFVWLKGFARRWGSWLGFIEMF